MRRLPILTCIVAILSSACCEETTVHSARSVDGTSAKVVSRGCGATVGFVTRVMLGSNEVLRMNADARTISVAWGDDGKTLFVSIPEDVATRDIFVKESKAAGRNILYRRRALPRDEEQSTTR